MEAQRTLFLLPHSAGAHVTSETQEYPLARGDAELPLVLAAIAELGTMVFDSSDLDDPQATLQFRPLEPLAWLLTGMSVRCRNRGARVNHRSQMWMGSRPLPELR